VGGGPAGQPPVGMQRWRARLQWGHKGGEHMATELALGHNGKPCCKTQERAVEDMTWTARMHRHVLSVILWYCRTWPKVGLVSIQKQRGLGGSTGQVRSWRQCGRSSRAVSYYTHQAKAGYCLATLNPTVRSG